MKMNYEVFESLTIDLNFFIIIVRFVLIIINVYFVELSTKYRKI